MYGLYQFNKHRGVTANLQSLSLHLRLEDWEGLSREDLEAIIQTAEIRIEGTQFTRDLVNESPETIKSGSVRSGC